MHTDITKTKKRPVFHNFNYFVRNTELHVHSAVIILTVYIHKLTLSVVPFDGLKSYNTNVNFTQH
jgi:hypothetical protein